MRLKNFIPIPTSFLALVAINLFVSNLSNAMFDSENEVEERKITHVVPKDQKRLEEIEIEDDDRLNSVPVPQDNNLIGILPDDILMYVFGFLTVEDLGRVSQVSRRWYEVCAEPQLWRKVGLENYRDYFTKADLEEKPKEKVTHHYLSVRLNVLDTEEEAIVSKQFKEKYGLTSLIPYFKAYLPSPVKRGHESFGAKIYGKFEVTQDIETKKEIEKLRCERDGFIQLAESEATKRKVANPYYRDPEYFKYCGGYFGNIPNYALNPTITVSAPSKTRLESAREANEKLIALGDENAVQKKKEQLTTSYSEGLALRNLYQGHHGDWDLFVKNSVEDLCFKGYLFAFQWKIEWLVEHNEDGTEFIASLLQNENPVVRNMGRYLKVFGLKQGKIGYKQNQEEAIEYIILHNAPY